MKVNQNVVRQFQVGGEMAPAPEEQGAMPAEAGAPMEEQGGAEEQLQQIAGELVNMLMQQIQDPNAVMAILDMAMQMVQQQAQPQQAQFQRQGGKLIRVR